MTGIGASARNTPGALYHLLLMTAQKLGSDVVLIDLNPSLSKLNKLAIAASDAFILPAFGDFFSHRSVETLTMLLPEFVKMAMDMRKRSITVTGTKTATIYPLPVCRPQFLGCLIRLSLAKEFDAAPAAQRGWISRVQGSVGALRAKLRAVALADIGWTPELAATVGGTVQLAPEDDVLCAEDMDPASCTIGFVPDHFSLNGFSHALSIPTPMLEVKLLNEVCEWSKRSTEYNGVSSIEAYFKAQHDFKKRIHRYKAVAREYVKRTLRLLAATPAIAGTELGATLTAAAAAEWVKRVDGPAFAPGPFPDDFDPYQTYPGSRAIEEAYKLKYPPKPRMLRKEEESESEPSEDDDDGDWRVKSAAAGANVGKAVGTASGKAVGGVKRSQPGASGGPASKKAKR